MLLRLTFRIVSYSLHEHERKLDGVSTPIYSKTTSPKRICSCVIFRAIMRIQTTGGLNLDFPNNFRVLTQLMSADDEQVALKSYYASWRSFNKDTEEPFFALYEGFKNQHLATLESGPLRLFLYFGFHSKNQTGDSWHSISTIAEFFNTQTRTVDNWIKTLVDKGLIYRVRKGHRSHTTYIIPYSDTLIQAKPKETTCTG